MSDIQDVVQAKAFQLVDDDGSVRAEMKLSEDGSPEFVLRDQYGQDRLVARIDGFSASLSLSNQDGQARFDVSVDESGDPSLSLRDHGGKPRLSASLDESGRPSLDLRDQDEQPRLSVSLDRTGQPGLYLRDDRGQKSLILGTDIDYDSFGTVLKSGKLYKKEGLRQWYMEPGLYILDRHGQDRFAVYVSGDDRSWLYLADQDSVGRIVAVVDQSSTHLSLRDRDANILGSANRLVAELDEHGQPLLYLTDDKRETIVTVNDVKKNKRPIERMLQSD